MGTVWYFVVVAHLVGGVNISEAFDYDSAATCEQRRAVILEFLLTAPSIDAFHIGVCEKAVLVRKS